MRDSPSVLLEMFVAGDTTPAGKNVVAVRYLHHWSSSSSLSQVIIFVPFLSVSVRDSFISTMLSKQLPSANCRRWLYEDIKEARFMRFLLEVRHPNDTTDDLS